MGECADGAARAKDIPDADHAEPTGECQLAHRGTYVACKTGGEERFTPRAGCGDNVDAPMKPFPPMTRSFCSAGSIWWQVDIGERACCVDCCVDF